jgi:hypothetical protein
MVNAEKNKIWDKKCTKINIYIGGRRKTKAMKIHKKHDKGKREYREKGNNADSDNII